MHLSAGKWITKCNLSSLRSASVGQIEKECLQMGQNGLHNFSEVLDGVH